MRTVSSHLKHFGVDKQVSRRVHQFYEFRFQNKLMFQDDDILDELPVKLKSTIVLQRFQKTGIHRLALLLLLSFQARCLDKDWYIVRCGVCTTVERVPFFRRLSEDVVILICVQFREFSVLPGDDIIHRGDPYRELLVLTKGAARSVPPSEEESETPGVLSPRARVGQETEEEGGTIAAFSGGGILESVDRGMSPTSSEAFRHRFQLDAMDAVIEYPTGSIFGELEFLGLTEMRPTTIRAKTYSELSSLHPHDVEPIIDQSPALKRRLSKYVLFVLLCSARTWSVCLARYDADWPGHWAADTPLSKNLSPAGAKVQG